MLFYEPQFKPFNCRRCKGTGRRVVRGLHELANIGRRAKLQALEEELSRFVSRMHANKKRDMESQIAELRMEVEPREKVCTGCTGTGRIEHVLMSTGEWKRRSWWERRHEDGKAFVKMQEAKTAKLYDIDERNRDRTACNEIWRALHRAREKDLLLPPAHDALAPLVALQSE